MSEQLLSNEYPDDWNVTTVGDLAERVGSGVTPTGGSEVYKDSGVIFIRSQNVTNEGLKLNDVAFIDFDTHTKMSASSVENFDVLINITGASIGRVTYVPKGFPVANVNQHVCEIRFGAPSEAAAKFYSYILQSDIGQRQIHCLNAGGNREGLNFQQLRSFVVPEPPKDQINKIAKILSTVDNLIEKTQTLIDKYTAIKQGMMADLFTRGIDMTTSDTSKSKGGELRPSVEDAPELYKQTELGWVPKEWEVRSIEDVSLGGFKNGYFKDPRLVGTGMKLINVSELYQDYGIDITTEKVERIKVSRKDYAKYKVEIGDIFFTRSSLVLEGIAKSNIVRVLPEEAVFECHVMRLKPDQNQVVPEFLAIYSGLPAARNYLMSMAKQVTMTTIAQPDMVGLPVPVPSIEEQSKVIQKLNAIEGLIVKENAEMQKNKGIKKGLMQDLLTGKVRVS